MDDPHADGRLGDGAALIVLPATCKRVPMSTDWHWLDPLTPTDLDSDFMEAVAERRIKSTRSYRSSSTEAARARTWNGRKQAGGRLTTSRAARVCEV